MQALSYFFNFFISCSCLDYFKCEEISYFCCFYIYFVNYGILSFYTTVNFSVNLWFYSLNFVIYYSRIYFISSLFLLTKKSLTYFERFCSLSNILFSGFLHCYISFFNYVILSSCDWIVYLNLSIDCSLRSSDRVYLRVAAVYYESKIGRAHV